MTEYKIIDGIPCFSDDDWKTCKVGIKEKDLCFVGDLRDLDTVGKDIYEYQYDYYLKHPVEGTEMILGRKLKWYQKSC